MGLTSSGFELGQSFASGGRDFFGIRRWSDRINVLNPFWRKLARIVGRNL